MAIVKDLEKTLEQSDKLSWEIFKLFCDKSKEIKFDDDPAEQIFFAAHVVGSLAAHVAMMVEGFANTYAVAGLNAKELLKWVYDISKEYVDYKKKCRKKHNEKSCAPNG